MFSDLLLRHPVNSTIKPEMGVCVYVCACVCASVCVLCVCVCVCVEVHVQSGFLKWADWFPIEGN